MAALDHLRVDHLYRNTNDWHKPADQFNRFFRFRDGKGINNTSGFRPKSALAGSTDIVNCAFCVLVTSAEEAEWPDSLDPTTALFTYYGDNRSPGKDLHDTTVGGNRLLREVFARLHSNRRSDIPPFLCFEKIRGADGTYMRFLGLAAPGARGNSANDDLVAVWRIKAGRRFQNYRARFTILRTPRITKEWLDDLVAGRKPDDARQCPPDWDHWCKTGIYQPLECEKQLQPRKKLDQLSRTPDERRVLHQLLTLSDREFEFAAAELTRLMDSRFVDLQVTPHVRDGGRDVLASYVVGHTHHEVRLSVLVEAKRWNASHAVGVRPMMRLVSRIKHRDIGVFVTTSFFDRQVQQELLDDRHPVLLISGGDIARLLIDKQLGDASVLAHWIDEIRERARSG